jgi:hypothetical protein
MKRLGPLFATALVLDSASAPGLSPAMVLQAESTTKSASRSVALPQSGSLLQAMGKQHLRDARSIGSCCVETPAASPPCAAGCKHHPISFRSLISAFACQQTIDLLQQSIEIHRLGIKIITADSERFLA